MSPSISHSCPSLIAPSLLSCDLANLAVEAQQMLDLGADWLVRFNVIICRRVPFLRRHIVPSIAFTKAHHI
jgi:hypothetical protein